MIWGAIDNCLDVNKDIPFQVFEYNYSIGFDLLTIGLDHTSNFDLDMYDGTLQAIDKIGVTNSKGEFEFTMIEAQMEDDYIIIFNINDGANVDYCCIADYKFDGGFYRLCH